MKKHEKVEEFRARSHTNVVKELVRKMKSSPGYNPSRWRVSAKLGDDGGIFWGDPWRVAMSNSSRAIRRAKKKLRQPFRKNMKRRTMHRKAAGKNEVTRRR